MDRSKIFWEAHKGLPRQGPGGDIHTRRAFHAAGHLPPDAVIVDVGCGPGMQTLELARLSKERVIGIDKHAPFLTELEERARRAGLGERIVPTLGDMHDLAFEPNSIDLLWCEGAIYILGFERGLQEWGPMLRPGGVLAVSELSWLKPGAPKELTDFWQVAYPAMVSVDDNVSKARTCGYQVIDRFVLPPEAWSAQYYDPLAERIAELRKVYATDGKALAALDEEALEIELFCKYHEFYGYLFLVLRHDGSGPERVGD